MFEIIYLFCYYNKNILFYNYHFFLIFIILPDCTILPPAISDGKAEVSRILPFYHFTIISEFFYQFMILPIYDFWFF